MKSLCIFGLFVGQKKQFEDVPWVSEKLWWAVLKKIFQPFDHKTIVKININAALMKSEVFWCLHFRLTDLKASYMIQMESTLVALL